IPLGNPAPGDTGVQRVSYSDPPPVSDGYLVRVQSTDAPPPPPLAVPPPAPPGVVGTPAEQYNCGVATHNPAPGGGFWDKAKGCFTGFPWCKGVFDTTGNQHLFESDHSFDGFISPVTNPFYFEDPRSLTEVRPIFMWQGSPTKNPIFHGGDIEFFGLQGRL